jgi:hypothetical protein
MRLLVYRRVGIALIRKVATGRRCSIDSAASCRQAVSDLTVQLHTATYHLSVSCSKSRV